MLVDRFLPMLVDLVQKYFNSWLF